MTHLLLEQLAAQRQSEAARRAASERRTAPTRATFPRRKVRGRSDRQPLQSLQTEA